MKKRIISVEYKISGKGAENISFSSNQSLLGADIIVFQPRIKHWFDAEDFWGKPLLSSVALSEQASHWRLELNAAFESGKTIFIFLSRLQEFYRFTGESLSSGAGKNRQVTRMVDLFDNYSSIPLSLGRITPKRGNAINPGRDLGVLSAYWQTFAPYTPEFEVYLDGQFERPVLVTETGNKILGAIIGGTKGTYILLPPPKYETPSKTKGYHENYWASNAAIFRKRLAEILVDIDRDIRKTTATASASNLI